MPIQSSDIVLRLSGGASNAAPASSLGGAKSSTVVGANIFDSVTGVEAAAGDVEYRCVYVHNSHGNLSLDNAVAWLTANTPSASTDVALGLGSSALNGTEQTVADEQTAPASVAFSAAANKAGGIALGSIPAGQSRAIWYRRTINAGAAAVASDTFTVRVEGDTAA